MKSAALVSLLMAATPLRSEPAPAALIELLTEEQRLADAAATLPPVDGIATMLAEDARVYARGGPFQISAPGEGKP